MADLALNSKEREAVRLLEGAARAWPKSLWLFSANGTLYVMQKRGGKRMTTKTGGMEREIRNREDQHRE
jgi:hypothetical protein